MNEPRHLFPYRGHPHRALPPVASTACPLSSSLKLVQEGDVGWQHLCCRADTGHEVNRNHAWTPQEVPGRWAWCVPPRSFMASPVSAPTPTVLCQWPVTRASAVGCSGLAAPLVTELSLLQAWGLGGWLTVCRASESESGGSVTWILKSTSPHNELTDDFTVVLALEGIIGKFKRNVHSPRFHLPWLVSLSLPLRAYPQTHVRSCAFRVGHVTPSETSARISREERWPGLCLPAEDMAKGRQAESQDGLARGAEHGGSTSCLSARLAPEGG